VPTTPPPPTGQIPVLPENDTATAPPATASWRRLTAPFADPVLRILSASALVSTLGRGVFFTLTVLYFTLIVGLDVAEVALVLTVSSAVGVLTGLLGGQLADRVSSRRLLFGLVLVEGIALIMYAQASSFGMVLAIACVVTGADRAAYSARSAIIARAFTGQDRVGARAILRTITNLGIALGSAAASVPLLVGTGDAFRVAIVLAGGATLASTVLLWRLPSRVDAPRRPPAQHTTPPRPAGRPPFRNPRYLALTALSGLFGIQFGLAEIGLPLWIVNFTQAPTVTVSVLLIVNTVLVIIFQIPLSRGTHDVRRAGNAVGLAGLLMLGACLLYAGSGAVPALAAIALLVIAMLLHTFAEVLSSAGTWGLSFELAEPERAGAYQGVFSMGFSVGAMVAPLVITVTVLTHGVAGWLMLAALFLGSALGIVLIARHHSRPNPDLSVTLNTD
jgi:MFS family permease